MFDYTADIAGIGDRSEFTVQQLILIWVKICVYIQDTDYRGTSVPASVTSLIDWLIVRCLYNTTEFVAEYLFQFRSYFIQRRHTNADTFFLPCHCYFHVACSTVELFVCVLRVFTVLELGSFDFLCGPIVWGVCLLLCERIVFFVFYHIYIYVLLSVLVLSDSPCMSIYFTADLYA